MLFKQVIGQENAKKRLIQTVSSQRVSHAQLFLGPEGSGKLPLALAYAQYINCQNRQEDDSCGHCPSCIKFNKLIHPDLHFVYPVSKTKDSSDKPTSKEFLKPWRELVLENNGYINLTDWYEKIDIEKKQGIINADDCNNIIKTLSYKSFESEYKIMIIWMVEKLFHSAAPKILKILEEPPEKTLFILISENQDVIINTILSRTQLVKIPKIANNDLYQELHQHYESDPVELKQIINQANGNYIEAINLLNDSETEKKNFILFRQWMRNCFQNKIAPNLEIISEISKFSREKQKAFLNYGLRTIRHCLLYQYTPPTTIKLEGEEMEFIAKFSAFINSSNALQFTDEFNKAIFHIERNANASVLFLDLSLICSKLLKIGRGKQ
ncbi:MAG TPA: DNA polymerase III subunit delta [Bacteroidales bacterium]|nr:DNA polymerase III subunit delta [Bacteroidales bacterium]